MRLNEMNHVWIVIITEACMAHPRPRATSKQFPILRGFNLEAAERMAWAGELELWATMMRDELDI